MKTAFPHHAFAQTALLHLSGRSHVDELDVQPLLPQAEEFELKQALRDVVEQLLEAYRSKNYFGLNCVQAYYSVQLLTVSQFVVPASARRMKVLGDEILNATGRCLEAMNKVTALPSQVDEKLFLSIQDLERTWRDRVFEPNKRWSVALHELAISRDWLSCESLKSVLLSLASVDIQLVPLYKHATQLKYSLDLSSIFASRIQLLGHMEEFLFSDMPGRKTVTHLERSVTNELMSIGHIQECVLSINKYCKNR